MDGDQVESQAPVDARKERMRNQLRCGHRVCRLAGRTLDGQVHLKVAIEIAFFGNEPLWAARGSNPAS
ncbi:hypothetical protein [Aminobacter aminovorans]|uniref:hypothetical protein n=1 Tax=Aminobacter aminovorans TaxID=83263 RepID=UPI00285D3DAA|nr:hypothetical protein [Aminobacter aminovorans]MDR7221711.1 hypothetical protein [Aminobacter aminovorans]